MCCTADSRIENHWNKYTHSKRQIWNGLHQNRLRYVCVCMCVAAPTIAVAAMATKTGLDCTAFCAFSFYTSISYTSFLFLFINISVCLLLFFFLARAHIFDMIKCQTHITLCEWLKAIRWSLIVNPVCVFNRKSKKTLFCATLKLKNACSLYI